MSFGGDKNVVYNCPFDSSHKIRGDRYLNHTTRCARKQNVTQNVEVKPGSILYPPVDTQKICYKTKGEKKRQIDQQLRDFKQKRGFGETAGSSGQWANIYDKEKKLFGGEDGEEEEGWATENEDKDTSEQSKECGAATKKQEEQDAPPVVPVERLVDVELPSTADEIVHTKPRSDLLD